MTLITDQIGFATATDVATKDAIIVTTTAAVTRSNFSNSTKKVILNKQKCCQYIDPITKKQCQSTWFLQVDHKQSRWAGGGSKINNAQVLCC